MRRSMTSTNAPLRVFIAGAGGFIGGGLRDFLRAEGIDVAGVDLCPPAGRDRVPAIDLLDLDQMVGALREWSPDVVFHVAGAVGLQDEDALQRAHVGTTETLLRGVQAACHDARIVVLGSAAEYGSSHQVGRIAEGTLARPNTAYGRSKLAQSELARRVAIQWDLDVIRVRAFNTLGPGQSPYLVAGAMVCRLDKAVLSGARSLEVYDPESQRDYLDVRDVARLLWQAARSIVADPTRPPVHVCSGEGVSVAHLARTLVEIAGVSDRVALSKIPRGVATRVVGDPSTLAALLGPSGMRQIDLSTSLRDMWEWQRRQSSGRSN